MCGLSNLRRRQHQDLWKQGFKGGFQKECGLVTCGETMHAMQDGEDNHSTLQLSPSFRLKIALCDAGENRPEADLAGKASHVSRIS
jgi:hypothetical protein